MNDKDQYTNTSTHTHIYLSICYEHICIWQVVSTPVEYAKCVKIIGNAEDMTNAEKLLEGTI